MSLRKLVYSGLVCLAFVQAALGFVATNTALIAAPATAACGAGYTFTATVTAAGATVPSGTVTFSDGAAVLAAAVPVVPGAVAGGNASGVATYTTGAPLTTGNHSITAAYSNGAAAAFSASVSAPSPITITAAGTPTGAIGTATTLTVSPSGATAVTGTALTFTVTVTACNTAPTGTVTLFDSDSAIPLGTVTLTPGAAVTGVAASVASFPTSSLITAGLHNITAAYSDATGAFNASTSPVPVGITITDYGRVQAIFTGGAMINNQQSSANSSTAGEFLDVEWDFSWIRAGSRPCPSSCTKTVGKKSVPINTKGHRLAPGFNTFFDGRLSPTPVATTTSTTTTTTTTASGSMPSTSTATNLNLLTSQQGLRVLIGSYIPFRFSSWNGRTQAFTVGPVAKASFDTILNPSVSSGSTPTTTSSSGGTTTTMISQTAGNFSSVYSSWVVGGRIEWDQFPASSDEAPRTWMQLDVTMGKYSNLPSYECVATAKGTAPPAGAATACTAGSNFPNISRVLVPRLDIAGFAKFPNYPFVLGFDANLAQYGIPTGLPHIDYLNKPGNDIRLYFGLTLDLASAWSKLGLPSF